MSIHLQAIYNDPHIGTDAVYSDGMSSADVRVILERDVEVYDGRAIHQQDQIALLCSQVSDPKQGHTVTIDGTTYKLVDRLKDDGLETRWSVST